MLFNTLNALIGGSGVLSVHIASLTEGRLQVTVFPSDASDEAALKQPLQLVGTPDELDAGFAEAVTSYSECRKSLAEQVEATRAILEAAKASTAAKGQAAIKSAQAKPVASKPATTPPKATPAAAKPDADGGAVEGESFDLFGSQ